MEATRFERARLLGARALQIACGAPFLVQVGEDEDLWGDPLAVALREWAAPVLPLCVRRAA
jgi:DNA-directed RNA polymerase subunit K